MGRTAGWYTSLWLAPGPSTASNSKSELGMEACLQGVQDGVRVCARAALVQAGAGMAAGGRAAAAGAGSLTHPNSSAPGAIYINLTASQTVGTPGGNTHSLAVHDHALAVGLEAQRTGRLALRLGRAHAHKHLDALCK